MLHHSIVQQTHRFSSRELLWDDHVSSTGQIVFCFRDAWIRRADAQKAVKAGREQPADEVSAEVGALREVKVLVADHDLGACHCICHENGDV